MNDTPDISVTIKTRDDSVGFADSHTSEHRFTEPETMISAMGETVGRCLLGIEPNNPVVQFYVLAKAMEIVLEASSDGCLTKKEQRIYGTLKALSAERWPKSDE